MDWFLAFALAMQPFDCHPELPPLYALASFPSEETACCQAGRWRKWVEWLGEARAYQEWPKQFEFDRLAGHCREQASLWDLLVECRHSGRFDVVRRESLAALRSRIGWAAFERGEMPAMLRDDECAPTVPAMGEPE